MRKAFFAFMPIFFFVGCATVEQQVVINSDYKEIAHAICSLSSFAPVASASEGEKLKTENVEIWVYASSSGGFLLRVKEEKRSAVFIDVNSAEMKEKESDLNISKKTLEFISDEKAMRQCFIASKFGF